jgi:Tol biopolymer transport system component
MPTWSPDGTKIVFSDSPVDGRKYRIWIVNIDGSDVHMISNTPGSHPEWSHTGNKIAFHGEVNAGIFIINADGTNEQRLSCGYYPSFSFDDSKIVFIDTDWTVWVMNADGTNPKKVSSVRSILPRFSPDGTKITFADLENGGIYTINTDGSNQTKIHNWGWSPYWGR